MARTFYISVEKEGTVTNGDMIKALFPSAEVKEEIVKTISNGDILVGYEVFLYIHKPRKKGDFGFGTKMKFSKEWWNSPYKAESDE